MPTAIEALLKEVREFFEERAAIREYEGPMRRPLAERFAVHDVKHRYGPAVAFFDKENQGGV